MSSPASPPVSPPASQSGEILVPLSPGELIDKITILEIKAERITDPAKLENVRYELARLMITRDQTLPQDTALAHLSAKLKLSNQALWEIEDKIRACEAAGDFGPDFIALARSVYLSNDRRAALKREINDKLGSKIVEEKSYTDYART